MLTILHFADAHIDMANYGRHDPVSGLPQRVMDFLKSLDTIVDTAIQEKVDLVLFAGDAYKDRNPAPTFQREWGKRVMRLSRAGIPTLLLVGNHDTAPALGRAHTLDPFSTLEVPNVLVLDRPAFLGPSALWDLPLQVIAIPWVSRSGLMASLELSAANPEEIDRALEDKLVGLVQNWLKEADQALPVVLTAHASMQGAVYGAERSVMLGGDLILPGSLVRDPRLDYVALGHIHKPQDLNENAHPPVVYPGSIERVDFGEAKDDKYFVIAHVERGHTEVEWRELKGIRPFIDRFVHLKNPDDITGQLIKTLPRPEKLEGAIVRLVIEYPRDWEALIDEAAVREYASGAFELHLIKRPAAEARSRLAQQEGVSSLTPLELLDVYWRTNKVDKTDQVALQELAQKIMEEPEQFGGDKQIR
jgi:DNA repair protein SbcD/Mre11